MTFSGIKNKGLLKNIGFFNSPFSVFRNVKCALTVNGNDRIMTILSCFATIFWLYN